MIRDDVCYLIAENPEENGLFEKTAKKERMVFCAIRSVTSSDYWRGKQAGAEPSIVFVLSEYADYHGERLIRYGSGKAARYYKVMRTYVNGHEIEITVEEAGVYVGNPVGAESL